MNAFPNENLRLQMQLYHPKKGFKKQLGLIQTKNNSSQFTFRKNTIGKNLS